MIDIKDTVSACCKNSRRLAFSVSRYQDHRIASPEGVDGAVIQYIVAGGKKNLRLAPFRFFFCVGFDFDLSVVSQAARVIGCSLAPVSPSVQGSSHFRKGSTAIAPVLLSPVCCPSSLPFPLLIPVLLQWETRHIRLV
jgi:hypothetical protein